MRSRIILLVFLIAVTATAHAQFFPYPVQKRTLPNGLDVIVIETPEFRNVLSFNTLILAGSGRENEKGRSGLAHLFEHIIFRHDHDTAKAYQPAIEKMGAFNNAYTWYDVTYYHPLTFTSNLEQLAALEGSRFRELRYSERVFRTEAGAVYGEYRRSASDPGLRIEEVLGDLMYGPAHGYGHSTIGYLDDVQDMPNAYKSAVAFYDTYYRPNNAIVVVAGDVKADEVFSVVEKHFGAWKAKKTPEQPDPKPFNGPKKQHETWESDIPPRVLVAYMVPPYVPGSPEAAAMDVMSDLMGSETAPLYKKLRYEEQVASDMGVDNTSSVGFDARPMSTYVTVAKDKYDTQGRSLLDRIDRDVATAFEGLSWFSSQPDSAARLEAIKSQLRYDILASFNSPANIAENIAMYYRFSRDPQVLEKVAAAIAALKPTDVDAFAKKYFTPKNRVSITLAGKGGAK
ncbi:MAG TPA: pitrilysin family protein [Thermoanaerobaculia bacterium]|nr:pitrilysin family protein [Thermoanaerobaculia bacterium]